MEVKGWRGFVRNSRLAACAVSILYFLPEWLTGLVYGSRRATYLKIEGSIVAIAFSLLVPLSAGTLFPWYVCVKYIAARRNRYKVCYGEIISLVGRF